MTEIKASHVLQDLLQVEQLTFSASDEVTMPNPFAGGTYIGTMVQSVKTSATALIFTVDATSDANVIKIIASASSSETIKLFNYGHHA